MKQNFLISYFSKINEKIARHVIYYFLIDNDVVNVSSFKINNVIQFIKSSKSNNGVRLGNGLYLHKKNGNLIFKSI
jgi:hypothetical protein